MGIPRRRQSPSQRFLEYTGGGTKSKLFKKLLDITNMVHSMVKVIQTQTAIGAWIW